MLSFRAMCVVLLVLHAGAVSASPNEERVGTFMAEEKRVTRLDVPANDKVALLAAAYAAVRSDLRFPDAAKEQDDGDLALLYRAADVASFYTSDRRYALDMLALATELQRRNLLTARQQRDTYLALVASRAYAPAKAWRERTRLTGIREADYELRTGVDERRSVELKLTEHGVEAVPFDVPPGPFVLVVTHPLCHFSQYAQDFIERNPALRNALQGHIKWVAVQQREPDMQAFRDWNDGHASIQIGQIYDISAWPIERQWETPVFYFFKDGRIVANIVGWPREGRAKELFAAMALAGFEGVESMR
ncbi:hypothetical protein [Massilia sp. TN1-12]|uniref:hypothetical protein n=1 Tax=Massilia paldalensis TaxID=3377675 RepID=UPI00384D34E4